ncbi:MAG: hypothetical protein QOC77_2370 [Thermoleophilaceae bacterium]|nr:hypothetical protein [Thermoleophilaceae bacterium]
MTGRSRWVFAGGLLAAVLAGCEDGKPNHASAPAHPSARIALIHDDGSLPRACGARQIASRALAFEDAFNRGDAAALDDLVADAAHFQWFTVSDGGIHTQRGFGAEGRTSAREVSPPDQRPRLVPYLLARHRRGERMRLLEITVTYVPPRAWFPNIADQVGGITFTTRRDGPDFPALGGSNRIGGGKAGFRCADGRLLAWSMGLDAAHAPSRTEQRQCRNGRRDRVPPGRTIVCTT